MKAIKTKRFKINITKLPHITFERKDYTQWILFDEKNVQKIKDKLFPFLKNEDLTEQVLENYQENHDVYIDVAFTERFNDFTKFDLLRVESENKENDMSFSPLNKTPITEQKKYPLSYSTVEKNVWYAEYGRITVIAGVSGAGKTHTTLDNIQRLLEDNDFDRVLYIAKELGNNKIHQRFKIAHPHTTAHNNLDVVNNPLAITEKNILDLLKKYAAKHTDQKILYVLDNGTNFALDTEDIAKAGLSILAVEIHEYLLQNQNLALLWLTQVQRSNIKDLFVIDKKTEALTFKMTLGDLKSSATLQELADTVIGLAKFNGEYYSTILKGGDIPYANRKHNKK